MATKRSTPLALFVLLNLLFFSLVSTASTHPTPKPHSRTPPGSQPGTPPGPQPGTPPGSGAPPSPPSGTPPGPAPGTPPSPPSGNPPGPAPGNSSCPRDALKLGICANVLSGLLNVTIGTPPVTPCCTLIQGLADLEAAVCLCTVIRANILGINLNLPIVLTLLLNVCSRQVPRDFLCA